MKQLTMLLIILMSPPVLSDGDWLTDEMINYVLDPQVEYIDGYAIVPGHETFIGGPSSVSSGIGIEFMIKGKYASSVSSGLEEIND